MSGTATTCLYSTVKNVSGVTMNFSFLPPHGRELEADEEFSVLGDITNAVVRNQRSTSKRYLDALLNSLNGATNGGDPTLQLIKTPNPILWNEDAEESKMVDIHNDPSALGLADPCTDSSL